MSKTNQRADLAADPIADVIAADSRSSLASGLADGASAAPRTSGTSHVRKEQRSPYVLLFFVLVFAAAATWIIPPGTFDYVLRDGVKMVVPHSLHAVPASHVGLERVFTAIAEGMDKSAAIIFLILFTGGAVGVIEATGAISSALSGVGRRAGVGDFSIIVSVAGIFSILGTTGVVMNSVVAFVPLGLLLARSMNLPAMFGVGLIYLGTFSGFNAGVLIPGTTGLSQRLVGLPIFSGMGLRTVIYIAFAITTIAFLTWYARSCRRSGAQNEAPLVHALAPAGASPQQWLILAFTAVSLMVFIFGAVQFHWSELEMTAMFIIIGIGAGLIGRMHSSAIANRFLSGCATLIPGALIVGLARAISIVLADGKILDPIVNFISGLLGPLHPAIAAIGMFFSAAAMHVAISSGSGESAALIPIYTPVGDTIHLTRQVTVQAVLLGEGVMNCFNPTSGVLMAVLATAGIGYGKWVRFVLPLVLSWFLISCIALVIAVHIHWGPF